MTRKELKAKEKEENRVLENEGEICTSIDRDGSRTIKAKEISRKAAEEKRRKLLEEKIRAEEENEIHEFHINIMQICKTCQSLTMSKLINLLFQLFLYLLNPALRVLGIRI